MGGCVVIQCGASTLADGGGVSHATDHLIHVTEQNDSRHKSPEQEAEPQRIVAQRLLSRLQYPVPYLSRLQRI